MTEEDRPWEGPTRYADWLADLKESRQARFRASLAVNHELVQLYWQVGTEILERQNRRGWGTRVIDHLAADLRREFPGVAGWSARNIKYMTAFGRDLTGIARQSKPCSLRQSSLTAGCERPPA